MTLSNLHMSKVRMLRRTGEILKGVAEIQYFYLQNLVETANSFF